jgi:hypothetical protein
MANLVRPATREVPRNGHVASSVSERGIDDRQVASLCYVEVTSITTNSVLLMMGAQYHPLVKGLRDIYMGGYTGCRNKHDYAPSPWFALCSKHIRAVPMT